MTQEEFKCVLVEQLKNPNGPIYKVLLRGDFKRNHEKSKYLKSVFIYSNDQSIGAIVSRLNNNNVSPCFDAVFCDLRTQENFDAYDTTICIDNGRVSLEICEEVITWADGCISFDLEYSTIEVIDYRFKRKETARQQLFSYDMRKLEFVQEYFWGHAIREWMEMVRISGPLRYIYYRIDEEKIDSLVKHMAGLNLPEKNISAILDAFTYDVLGNASLTSMMNVLNCLSSELGKVFYE